MHFRVKISAQTLAHNEITESQYFQKNTNLFLCPLQFCHAFSQISLHLPKSKKSFIPNSTQYKCTH